MAAPIDFQSVMAEVGNLQTAIAKIHGGLKNKKNKEILGDVLDQMTRARADVEIEYPKALAMVQETARRNLAKAQEMRANLEQQKAACEQRQAEIQAAQKKAAEAKPAKPEAKVDPALGPKLRIELLQRFSAKVDTTQSEARKIREAWQDWQ